MLLTTCALSSTFMFYSNRWVGLMISPIRSVGTKPITYKGGRVMHDHKDANMI